MLIDLSFISFCSASRFLLLPCFSVILFESWKERVRGYMQKAVDIYLIAVDAKIFLPNWFKGGIKFENEISQHNFHSNDFLHIKLNVVDWWIVLKSK